MIEMGEKHLHIMIVENHDMMRNLIKKLLAKAPISRITEATNGLNALELLKSGDVEPDVIISDLFMDHMNGDDFVRVLRADVASHSSRTPVLILTAEKSPAMHEAILMAGASMVATKPITGTDLIKCLFTACGYVADEQYHRAL
ncbi:MAG: response regulator [Alphaproteobacteria bacterium]|nr:response regulator [Alphaproteobacteria bacterium]